MELFVYSINTMFSDLCVYYYFIISIANTSVYFIFVFFFQAEDGIRDLTVTGVQTCALPILYVGTQSGVYGTAYDVGNSTSFAYSSAAPGQAYYFAVAAYFPGPVIGTKSTEVSGTSNGAPVLLNPGNQSAVVGNPVSLQLSGSDPAGQPVSYGVTALPPGLALTPATGRISGTPATPGSYLVTAIVSDGVLSDSETFT